MPARVKRVGLLVVSFVVVGAVWAVPARADRIGIVATSAPEAPATSVRLGDELERAALDRGATPVRDPFAVARRRIAAGAVERARLSSFGRAAQLLDEGWRSYLRVRHEFAASRLGSARTEAEKVLDLPGGLELYAEISLRLGAVKLELGQGTEADADFRLAAKLAPDRAVTDDEFKRSVVNAFALASRRSASESLSRSIDVRPKNARVKVDGELVGRAPVDVELEEGLHVVVVEGPGYRPLSQVISVHSGQSVKLSLELDHDPLTAAVAAGPMSLAPGTGEAEAEIAADAILTYAELDAVLLAAVVWRRGAPAVLGQWCSGSPRRCGGVVEIGYAQPDDLPSAARQMWRRARDERRRFPPLLPSDVRLTDAEKAPGTETGTGDRPVWKNPWVWLGAAGAALTVTAIVVLTRDQSLTPAIDVTPCQFARCPDP